MTLRFFSFDDPAHCEAAQLLPWLLNGTLDGEERVRVERHIARCTACSRELEAQRALQAAIASDSFDPAVDASMERLASRLDQDPRSARRGGQWHALRGWWSRAEPAARGLMTAQLALIAVLCGALAAVLLIGPSAPPVYRTLSDAPIAAPAGPAVVVVFHADRPESEIRSLLLTVDGRIVDGPSSIGAYTVQLPAGHLEAALQALRSDAGVAFAEPVPSPGTASR